MNLCLKIIIPLLEIEAVFLNLWHLLLILFIS
jgi:hypothetical protein